MSREDIQTFRDLHAWQAAMDLSLFAYELAKRLPPSERFELSAQMRRSAVSVPANVPRDRVPEGTAGTSITSGLLWGRWVSWKRRSKLPGDLASLASESTVMRSSYSEEQDSCSTVSPEAFSADGSNVGESSSASLLAWPCTMSFRSSYKRAANASWLVADPGLADRGPRIADRDGKWAGILDPSTRK